MNLAMFNRLYEVLRRDYKTFKEAQEFVDFDGFRRAEEAIKEKKK